MPNSNDSAANACNYWNPVPARPTDRGLIQAAHHLGVAHQWISGQPT